MKGRHSLKQSLDGRLFSQSPRADGGLVTWSGFKRNSDLSHLIGHRSESCGGENIHVGSIVQSSAFQTWHGSCFSLAEGRAGTLKVWGPEGRHMALLREPTHKNWSFWALKHFGSSCIRSRTPTESCLGPDTDVVRFFHEVIGLVDRRKGGNCLILVQYTGKTKPKSLLI